MTDAAPSNITGPQRVALHAIADGRVLWHAYYDGRPAHATMNPGDGQPRVGCTAVVRRLFEAGLIEYPSRLARDRAITLTYAGHVVVESFKR